MNNQFFVAIYQQGFNILGIGNGSTNVEAISNAFKNANSNGGSEFDLDNINELVQNIEQAIFNPIHGNVYYSFISQKDYDYIREKGGMVSYSVENGELKIEYVTDFPNILFETPDGWGAGFILTEAQAEEAAESLEEHSDDEYSIDECSRLFFVQKVDDTSAMYQKCNGKGSGQGYFISKDGDEFQLLKQFSSPEDFCYECLETKAQCACDE